MDNIHLHIFGSKVFFNLIEELNLEYKSVFENNKTYIMKNNFSNNEIRIVFVEGLKLTDLKFFFKQNVPTIFLSNNKDYILKNKLSLLEFHTTLLTPIDLLSFKEILKILTIKYIFFKQSKIIIGNYEIDSNQKIILKNDVKTKLTERELQLILALHKKNGMQKSMILKKIWNYNSDLDSHAFETNLHRLRKKIEKSFKDKEFIIEKNSLYYLSG
jgi:DNA-binding response OmpR family regulator